MRQAAAVQHPNLGECLFPLEIARQNAGCGSAGSALERGGSGSLGEMIAASPWATMDSLGYGSDGDDEFRSPNGLDLETSSEEVG